MLDLVRAAPHYLLPHHALSRVVFFLARRRSRLTLPAIRWFVRHFEVDLSEAAESDPARYPTFNAFFTRPLAAGARSITTQADALASPADGRISAFGRIDDGLLMQAKGRFYTLDQLLVHDHTSIAHLRSGSFITIYLAPPDYHRLHMPLSGELRFQTHVPGRLFSVAPSVTRCVPALFARNERVIAGFDTDHGLMVLVLVGAINVAAIETVWHGLVTPPHGRRVQRIDYTGASQLRLERGEEMGRFNMGSTIIALFERPVRWHSGLAPHARVRVGERLGALRSSQSSVQPASSSA